MNPMLNELEQSRYQDPRQTLSEATTLLPSLETEDKLQCFGIIGSCHRQLGEFGEAKAALAGALRLAERTSASHPVAGDLIQRVAYVRMFEGWLSRGLTLFDSALSRHLLGDSRRGIGRTLVGKGLILGTMEREEAALEFLKAATSYLPPDEKIHRFSAWQLQAYLADELGRADEACDALEEAKKLRGQVGILLAQKVDWAEARIQRSAGQYEKAVSTFQELAESYEEKSSWLTSVIAKLELAETLTLAGRFREVDVTLKSTAAYLTKLGSNPSATAVITKLVRASLKTRALTLEQVKAARMALNRAAIPNRPGRPYPQSHSLGM